MRISLKPQHLNRYRQIAWIFMKYGRSDLVKTTGLSEVLEGEQRVAPAEAAKANELAADLEKLGPTFVKLGQLLSTRVELLPQAYLEALSRLQDKVEPFSFGGGENCQFRVGRGYRKRSPNSMITNGCGVVRPGPSGHAARCRRSPSSAATRDSWQISDLEAPEEIADFLDQHTESGSATSLGRCWSSSARVSSRNSITGRRQPA